MDILIDSLTKIGVSLLIGSLLGLEREYQNKPAGFRTIALICVGATLFTILSQRLGSVNGVDRVAANIITGIGFIGAGVIFKNNTNVFGLTTAATIWVAAGVGMAVGAGEYVLAVIVFVVVLIVLSLFEYIQENIDIFHKRRLYFISFHIINYDKNIEKELKKRKIKFKKVKEKRNKSETTCEYEVFGKEKNLKQFNDYLIESEDITAFEY